MTPIFVTRMRTSYADFDPVKDEAKTVKRWFRCYKNYDDDHRVIGTRGELPATLLEAQDLVSKNKIDWKYYNQSISQIFSSIYELYAFAHDPSLPVALYYSTDGRKPVKRFLAPDMENYERYVLELRDYALRNDPGPENVTPTEEFLGLCEKLGWGKSYGRYASEALGISRQAISELKNGHSIPSKLMLRYMRLLVEGSKQ